MTRISMHGKFVFLIICQMLLLVYLGLEQYTNAEFYASYK